MLQLLGQDTGLVGSIEGLQVHQERGSRFGSCLGREMKWMVEAESSHWGLVVLEDIHFLGKVVVVGEEVVPEDQVGGVAVASDAGEGHVDLAVGEEQDLELLVHLVLPLYLRKDCLDRGRLRGALVGKDRHSEEVHQYLMDEGCLLELQVHDEDVGFPHHIFASRQDVFVPWQRPFLVPFASHLFVESSNARILRLRELDYRTLAEYPPTARSDEHCQRQEQVLARDDFHTLTSCGGGSGNATRVMVGFEV